MLDLARHYKEGPVLVKDIAARQDLSCQYLEQLLLSLKLAGLVRSTRGAGGGFMLAKEPGQIKLSQIVQVLEGTICPVECIDSPQSYSRSGCCATRDIWCRIKEAVTEVLEGVTLRDLAIQQEEKERAAGQMNSKLCQRVNNTF